MFLDAKRQFIPQPIFLELCINNFDKQNQSFFLATS